jgi:chemosensory pili system protein ChpA (sensor histidine kinase/response regulator)
VIDKTELFGYFLSEASDHISVLERGISELETSTDKKNLVEELFRSAHTLKGSAALLKLSATSNIAHKMEDILEGLMNQTIKANSTIVDALSYMLDGIKSLLSGISRGANEDLEAGNKILYKAKEILTPEKTVEPDITTVDQTPVLEPFQAKPEKEVSEYTVDEKLKQARQDAELFMGNFVRVDAQKVEDMLSLIGELTIKKNYILRKTKNITDISDEIFFTGRRLLMEVNDFAERYSYSLPENVKYVDPLLSEFGELEFDRYDELNLFSRKLQEITNDITESLKELRDFFEYFGSDIKDMDTMIKLLKSDLTDARMMEIGILFKRFMKPVKDIAKQHGKNVEFLIAGSLTKIDRVIFERLFTPLMHLIMNSIIHGIEKSDERVLKNKKPGGTVTLSASRAGGTVVIEVVDDGRGIDTQKIFKRAVEQGLLSADDKPTKEELISLIFIPGFSTAEQIDMAAGRGIGMNAVRRMIAGINGIIEISTDEGLGTTIRIKVPSSLAISNVILFRMSSLMFVIPASFVDEIMQFTDISEKGFIDYRGREIIAKEFSEVLGMPDRADRQLNYVIVCNVSNKNVGLIVDEVIGHEETVIKPLNTFLKGLEIYSGTTISGDGSIRFVINPIAIFEEQLKGLAAVQPIIEDYSGKAILIADDSISVRKYVTVFLGSKKFKVYTASNGVEALNLLYEKPVDMIITDLEMPVMHGYEFISRVKASEKLRNIPLIVLTSRGGQKHKRKAEESGADGYLIKPFDEDSLSNILKKFFSVSFV